VTDTLPETATETRSLFCAPSTAPDLEPTTIVLFGATGDLARRKLLPGLFHLCVSGLLPQRLRLIGVSSDELSDQEFRERVRLSIAEFGRVKPEGDAWDAFAAATTYTSGSFGPGQTEALRTAVAASMAELGGPRKLFFSAVPPGAFGAIARGLGEAGLTDAARVILEKPFGTDLASARELNAIVHSVLDEQQVFRIDHFLGKEAVQNLLAFRFANGLFEPVWTVISSTTSSSTCRRPCRSGRVAPSTRRPAPCATWSSRTSSRCSPSPPWSRPRRSGRTP